jgi:hypothetical protein
MPTHQESVLFSKPVLEMFTVANDFCIFMNEVSEYGRADITHYLQRISALLYLKGALLPAILPSHAESAARFVTEEEWESLFNTLRMKCMPYDSFWFTDPENNDTVKGSISEHYADVFRYMKDFVVLYASSRITDKENALFLLQDSFARQWGRKLINAMQAIHTLVCFTDKQY